MVQAILEAILEPVIELFFRLPGYLLLRCVLGPSVYDLEGDRVLLVGLLVWIAVGGTVAIVLWLR